MTRSTATHSIYHFSATKRKVWVTRLCTPKTVVSLWWYKPLLKPRTIFLNTYHRYEVRPKSCQNVFGVLQGDRRDSHRTSDGTVPETPSEDTSPPKKDPKCSSRTTTEDVEALHSLTFDRFKHQLRQRNVCGRCAAELPQHLRSISQLRQDSSGVC